MRFDRCNQLLETDAGQEDDSSNLSRHDSVSELDGLFVLVDRDLSHGGANERNAAKSLDQSCEIIATSAFQGRDTQPTKRRTKGGT